MKTKSPSEKRDLNCSRGLAIFVVEMGISGTVADDVVCMRNVERTCLRCWSQERLLQGKKDDYICFKETKVTNLGGSFVPTNEEPHSHHRYDFIPCQCPR